MISIPPAQDFNNSELVKRSVGQGVHIFIPCFWKSA